MTAHDIDLAALGRYDTPTICNALLAVAPEAARHSTKAMLHCARPGLPPMVGYARTTLYRTQEPGGLDAEGERAQDLDWFDYVARGPAPRIVMVQDADTPHAASNALFGEVMSFMHSALGCIGLVTNGAVRDVAGMAEGFQVLCGGHRAQPRRLSPRRLRLRGQRRRALRPHRHPRPCGRERRRRRAARAGAADPRGGGRDHGQGAGDHRLLPRSRRHGRGLQALLAQGLSAGAHPPAAEPREFRARLSGGAGGAARRAVRPLHAAPQCRPPAAGRRDGP